MATTVVFLYFIYLFFLSKQFQLDERAMTEKELSALSSNNWIFDRSKAVHMNNWNEASTLGPGSLY